MIASAVNVLLLALLTILPVTAAGSGRAADDPKEKDVVERVVVTLGDEDLEVDGDDPIVLRVGRRGFIGVSLIEITPELRAHYGAPKDAGVLVSDVASDTPAAKAGLEVGDVITAVDGERVGWTGDVSRAIRGKKAGETVQLDVVRGRASRKLTVTVEERQARERSIDLGDMDNLRRHAWVMKDFGKGFGKGHAVLENLEDFRGMRERLEDLEKRMKELEKRLPAR
jgi:membrane-associated protease RseP (regulator of RpoE activity)